MAANERSVPEAQERTDEVAEDMVMTLIRRGAESGQLDEVPQHVHDIAAIALQTEAQA